ncbi:hypothetical protein GBAR_LOCUS3542 [Geodia barretti]|uniref:Uncharacterized protein n=1 Tax=Geodia barretti TaxID=519541 RepID=A0AA35W1K8_GEOBA|nr:hypothetical protein GBAR_LOCUS3542 [Geodia barretti]
MPATTHRYTPFWVVCILRMIKVLQRWPYLSFFRYIIDTGVNFYWDTLLFVTLIEIWMGEVCIVSWGIR